METMDGKFFNMRAGMLLCTGGEAQILVNGVPYRMARGVFRFLSPALHVCEIARSADYRECVIADDIGVFYHELRPMFGTFVKLRILDHPCLQLDEALTDLFLDHKRRTDARLAELQQAVGDEAKALSRRLLQLTEQEALLEFIRVCHRRAYVEPMPVEHSEEVVFDFLYSLNMHRGQQRQVARYAAEAHLSQAHFARIVKARTGKSPSEWIAVVTILNAKTLLGQTDMSIKQVAETLHFPEQFTFRKFFKRHTGLSPKDFRRKSRETGADAGLR